MTAPNPRCGEPRPSLSVAEMEVLQAAEDRQLAAVVDVVDAEDQAHLVWLRPGHPVTPAAEQVTRLVVHLLMSGLAQVGVGVQMLSWRGGLAPGRRVLPTEQGRALLEQWRQQRAAEQAASTLPVITFGGSDHR